MVGFQVVFKLKNMDFEKIIIWIIWFVWGLISKIVYDIYENHKKWLSEEKEFDKKIYVKIKEQLLPLNWWLWFIKDFNFAWFSFESSRIKDLFYISDTQIDNPDLKFLDKKLEKLKKDLFLEIKGIAYELSTNTFPQWEGRVTVPSEWELEQPERFTEVVDKLHSSSLSVWKKYNNFVNYWRKKFKS